jgi:hypothetical protein
MAKAVPHNFADSALIGHTLGFSLLRKLISNGILTEQDATEVCDEALLQLEQFQSSFPQNRQSFERAREFLSEAVRAFQAKGETPPGTSG